MDIQDKGIKAEFYHAGMKPEERKRVQNYWTYDKIQIIVATIGIFCLFHKVKQLVDSQQHLDLE